MGDNGLSRLEDPLLGNISPLLPVVLAGSGETVRNCREELGELSRGVTTLKEDLDRERDARLPAGLC